MGMRKQCGREIATEEIEHIQCVCNEYPGLSRKELAETICEHLEWVTASGANKVQACLKLLEKLANEGMVHLPEKGAVRGPSGKVELTNRTKEPGVEVVGRLGDLGDVWLEAAMSREDKALWNEYVERYHYLGYKKPFGFRRRYFIDSGQGRLGCVLLAGAAKALTVRDTWIGWDEVHRLQNLPWVVNNARFLLFPWVRVKNLASYVLGQVVRCVPQDWKETWGFRPALMETFVDPGRFKGVSYRAAGWEYLGMTTGHGLVRPGKTYETVPKMIFMKPLVSDFREQLCGHPERASESWDE